MRYFLRSLLIITIFLLPGLLSEAQQVSFDPFPKKDSASYHLDFTQYFSNEGDEKKDMKKFYNSLENFYSLKDKTRLSAKNLLTALTLQDSLLIRENRHYIYHNLLASVNRNNVKSRDLSEKIDADFSAKTIFFEKELTGLSNEALTKFIKQEPAIKQYEYYIQRLLRNKKHQVNSAGVEKITGLTPFISGWQFDLYQAVTRNIKFPDRTPAATNSDSIIRAEGFKKLYAGYNSQRDLYAFALIKLAKANDEEAGLRNFPDAAEYYYFNKFHTKASISKLLNQIVDSIHIYKQYQQVRADFKRTKLGLKKIQYWDMGVSPGLLQPRFTIDSAQQVILTALQPLGREYEKELFDLLNPANRRMEIAPDKNKRSGGFSRGFIGTNSIFYAGGYNGLYNDVRIITHESTHAVHRQLMNKNKVIPVYASGPNYFFESFAIFSEFLLSDFLIENGTSKEEKQYYFEQYFEGKGMVLFSVASDALLEQKIHEGVKNGTINNADDLDSINESVNKIFSIWDTKEYPQLNQRWITGSLFYEDPFYEINYVLGAMLALKYYQLYKQNKNLFAEKYIALLKNGFTEAPQPLLKKFLGIDINEPGLLTDAIKTIHSKVLELENLYKE